MKIYNRYQHCGETFYTGRKIDEIVCSECSEQIKYSDIIQTEEPVSKQDDVTPVNTYNSEEEIQ